MAAGYTQVTGRMQAVLLHAGAGLLQGSMAIFGARLAETPMLILSGKSQSFGEGDVDPGPQWYRSLNVVGGPQRLIDCEEAPRKPIVGSLPACCACPARGHATAAPPISAMNCRRFMGLVLGPSIPP